MVRQKFKSGALVFDLLEFKAYMSGTPVRLTRREAQLLYLLMTSGGMVLRYETIQNLLPWCKTYTEADQTYRRRTHHIYIAGLRRKLSDNRFDPIWISTIQRVGYSFVGPPVTLEYEGGQLLNRRIHGVSELTSRQGDIIQGVSEGKTNMTIANELELSQYTIRNEVISLLRKFGLKSRSQLAYIAGWIDSR